MGTYWNRYTNPPGDCASCSLGDSSRGRKNSKRTTTEVVKTRQIAMTTSTTESFKRGDAAGIAVLLFYNFSLTTVDRTERARGTFKNNDRLQHASALDFFRVEAEGDYNRDPTGTVY